MTGRKSLCSFAKLLGLDRPVDPPVKDLDDGRSRLKALGPHRSEGVRDNMGTVIRHGQSQVIAEGGTFQDREPSVVGSQLRGGGATRSSLVSPCCGC